MNLLVYNKKDAVMENNVKLRLLGIARYKIKLTYGEKFCYLFIYLHCKTNRSHEITAFKYSHYRALRSAIGS
mgnify:CR=1 FL=1